MRVLMYLESHPHIRYQVMPTFKKYSYQKIKKEKNTAT